jgi:hypothetical protein
MTMQGRDVLPESLRQKSFETVKFKTIAWKNPLCKSICTREVM